MNFTNLLILLVILILIFSVCNKNVEGAVFNDISTVNTCDTLSSAISDYTTLALPFNIDGKFIDIDARDKHYLYAVTDNHVIYKCKKPCKSTDGLVNWEVVPMGVSGYDITRIFSSDDFLWGLNEIGEPVYSFKENNEILDDFRRKLEDDDSNEMNSYSELEPNGYCKKELITVNNISDILEANESLENCQALCNKSIKNPDGQIGVDEDHPSEYDGICDFLSYSNSLKICNMYQDERRSDGISTTIDNLNACNDPENRQTNSNFTTYKRNSLQLDLSNQIG